MKLVYAENGVAFLKSEMILSSHGFSTRVGGVSTLSHTESLNLAFGRGDEKEMVLRNLELFGEAVGIDAKSICSAPQIHSSKVVCVNKVHRGVGYFTDADFKCDGYVTGDGEVSVGVKTADCIPILLEGRDENGRVMAVGALHAGWRGTARDIASEGVRQMEMLGVSTDRIYAAIGSGICQKCFQVRADCRNEILKLLGSDFEKFIINDADGEHYYPDLQVINRELLIRRGVAAEKIDISPYCTCCEDKLFYSHRRMNGVRGTMLAVIAKD